MKNPKLVHKKRLKRKKVAAKHLAAERDRTYLLRLPKATAIKILQRRADEARKAKQAKRLAKKKKKVIIPNMHASNAPIKV